LTLKMYDDITITHFKYKEIIYEYSNTK
jgi:hypothetical protein